MNSESQQGAFALSGIDTAFGSRTKDIFASLDSIEAKHVAHENTPLARRESASLMKPDPDEVDPSTHHREADDKFRQPDLPARKRVRTEGPTQIRAGVPGHVTCPSKWTKYDLSDVSAGDLSESSNVGAAMDFLSSRTAPSGRGEAEDDNRMEEETMSGSESGIGNTSGGIRHKFHRPAGKVSSSAKSLRAVDLSNKDREIQVTSFTTDPKDSESAEAEDSDDVASRSSAEIGAVSSAFVHHKSRGRSTRFAVHKKRDSDSDSDNDEAKTPTAVGSNGAVAAAEDNGSDSDDFSELAQLEPDSDDGDGQFDDDEQPLDLSEKGLWVTVSAHAWTQYRTESVDWRVAVGSKNQIQQWHSYTPFYCKRCNALRLFYCNMLVLFQTVYWSDLLLYGSHVKVIRVDCLVEKLLFKKRVFWSV